MNETYRKLLIVLEIDRAIKYLRLGLGEIQKITLANNFYDPIFLYLSGGLERLFKTMLCLSFEEKNNRLPEQNDIWKNGNGYDIKFLKNEIEKICIPVTQAFASMDVEIITKDEFSNQICSILSEFARRARYFNLDAVLGVDQKFDAYEAWEKMESTIGKEIYGQDKYYKLILDPKQTKVYIDINQEIVIRLEKFFRALTRQFIFGDFSSKAKTFLFQIELFTNIDDNQLGKTDYR